MRGHHSFPSWTQYKSRWTCVSVRHRQFHQQPFCSLFLCCWAQQKREKEEKKEKRNRNEWRRKKKKGKHIHRYMHTQKQEMGEYMPLTQTDRREFYFLSSYSLFYFSRKHRVHLMQRNLSLTDLLFSHSLCFTTRMQSRRRHCLPESTDSGTGLTAFIQTYSRRKQHGNTSYWHTASCNSHSDCRLFSCSHFQ